ncbi:glycosyltransferase family 2 protein [Bacillus sp. FJAT-45066]|uniref:glycosyltransferase family 2 protein n=1 Tax=Bacillus sp. FJAT-45066 TaxID=2011010 RepID=UPI000BB94537|nr:glycosyltransferase family 2 protein [Bacillus sp. FJAT-45066]
MSRPMFSILIPVYNVEKFLSQCIDSILEQTYQNFEVVLINDGSTDSSGFICSKYAEADKRIKVFNQENQGLLMSRRNAISKATGEYLLFLDSDDYWNNNLLEMVYSAIIKFNCDLVIFKYSRVSEKNLFIKEAHSVFHNEAIFDENNKEELFREILSSSELNNLVCKVVKHSIMDEIDYRPFKGISSGEDLLQSVPLIVNSNKIVYLDKSLYNYRITSGSITTTVNKRFFKDVTIVRETVLTYLKKQKYDNEANNILFYNYYLEIIINYFYVIAKAKLNKKEKINFLVNLKKEDLILEAIPYIKYSKIKLVNKLPIYFLKNNYYNSIIIYTLIAAKLNSIFRIVLEYSKRSR